MKVYYQAGKTLSLTWCQAFAAGCGGEVTDGRDYQGGPWAGYGSPVLWPRMMQAIKAGQDLYYGDHAYFGRGVYFRVTKNGFQHDGRGGEPDYSRLQPFWEKPKPWRKAGRHILVCTQTPAYYQRFGIDNWLRDTVNRLRLHSDRDIIVREKTSKRPLAADMQDAWAVVCCTSNSAVEAIMEGIPAIVTGQCAASAMSLCDPALVEYPRMPDDDERMDWAARLAANQWTLAEITAGQCWEKIQ